MYAKLVESKDREEERMNRERYKMVRKKTKLSIMEAKTATFECWYVEQEDKGRDKKLYKLAKARERNER